MADDQQRLVFIGSRMQGGNMAGRDLEGADFRAADCRGMNFTGCNLRYADFRGADCVGASFQDAKLYGSRMQGMKAWQADFRGANIQQVNFGGAYMNSPFLPPSPGGGDPAASPGTQLAAAASPAPASLLVFIGGKLRGSSMAGLNLEGADFRAADCRGMNFTGCNLRHADFRGADAFGAIFQNADLHGSLMQGIDARQALFAGASNIEAANFGGAYLEGALLLPPVAPAVPSVAEILLDPKRFLSPEQANSHDPHLSNGHGRKM